MAQPNIDIDEFAAPDFDVKGWVNKALSEDLPADVLVELAFSDVVQALDEAGKVAVNNIPRVLRDIDTVRYDAGTLRERLDVVREDIEKVESETGKSIATISSVDKIKARMETTSESLRHAQRWDILLLELERMWSDSNIYVLAEKVKEMRRALRSFTLLPDIDIRRKQLEDAETRLESLTQPPLLEAFSRHDLDATVRFMEIYDEMGKGDTVRECYYRCHQAAAVSTWASLVESHPAADQKGCDLRVVLKKMYDYAVSLLGKEAPWTVAVFGAQARAVQCTLLARIFEALSPPLPDCMGQVAGPPTGDILHTPADSLGKLLAFYKETISFAKAADESIRGDDAGSAAAVVNLMRAIYGPFTPYQRAFGDIVRRVMAAHLDNLKLTSSSFQASAHSIADSSSRLFAMMDASVDQCAGFTSGLAFPELINAVDDTMADFVGKLEARVSHMRSLGDLDKTARKTAEVTAYQQDWSHFQGAVVLLQACGDLILRLDRLAAAIVSSLVDEADKVVSLKNESLSAPYNYLSATPRICASVQANIRNIRNGDMDVLAQSKKSVKQYNNTVHRLAFDILFNQVDQYLSEVPTLSTWGSMGGVGGMLGMPSFSVTQQNYVTQVGQHMLTLPQQLELIVSGEEDGDNPGLRIALATGSLPFVPKKSDAEEEEEGGHAAEWLEAVAVGTMQTYVERIMEIPKLTQHGTKQLVKDMEYLNNVLNVLDVDPTDEWSTVLKLLSAPVPEMKAMVAELPPGKLRQAGDQLAAIRVS